MIENMQKKSKRLSEELAGIPKLIEGHKLFLECSKKSDVKYSEVEDELNTLNQKSSQCLEEVLATNEDISEEVSFLQSFEGFCHFLNIDDLGKLIEFLDGALKYMVDNGCDDLVTTSNLLLIKDFAILVNKCVFDEVKTKYPLEEDIKRFFNRNVKDDKKE
jgi:hypothetical protein